MIPSLVESWVSPVDVGIQIPILRVCPSSFFRIRLKVSIIDKRLELAHRELINRQIEFLGYRRRVLALLLTGPMPGAPHQEGSGGDASEPCPEGIPPSLPVWPQFLKPLRDPPCGITVPPGQQAASVIIVSGFCIIFVPQGVFSPLMESLRHQINPVNSILICGIEAKNGSIQSPGVSPIRVHEAFLSKKPVRLLRERGEESLHRCLNVRFIMTFDDPRVVPMHHHAHQPIDTEPQSDTDDHETPPFQATLLYNLHCPPVAITRDGEGAGVS